MASPQGATHVTLEPQVLDDMAGIQALPHSVQQFVFKPPNVNGLYRYIVANSVARIPEVIVDLSRVRSLPQSSGRLAAELATLQVCL